MWRKPIAPEAIGLDKTLSLEPRLRKLLFSVDPEKLPSTTWSRASKASGRTCLAESIEGAKEDAVNDLISRAT